jgi:AraC family transcriptional activator of pyochelin receptor
MQAIDFSTLVETIRTFVPPSASLDENIYERDEGVRVRSAEGRDQILQEIVRLGEGAFLFASEDASAAGGRYQQVVHDSDWIHIQFRVSGGGCENIAPAGVIGTPEKFFIVARYPQDSLIERTVDDTNGWKVACLLVKPDALTRLIDVPTSRLPESVLWMAREEQMDLKSSVLPLQSSMTLAVGDILSCPLRGAHRRAYMRAKSLELLCLAIHALTRKSGAGDAPVKLSAPDLKAISLARTLMTANLGSTCTLRELARRVGLNRTKLAVGFKAVFGVSVHAFWRDAKLDRGREMLGTGEASVTDVALSLGYAELSSFTRAFSRRFGVMPRACRAEARRIVSRD